MLRFKRPFLVVPVLIEQPTWGGSYILSLKGWKNHPEYSGRKIGQSYELYGRSKLLLEIVDTDYVRFLPELHSKTKPGVMSDGFPFREGKDYVSVSHVEKQMPLLLKMNQAYGNSYQLHIKPNATHPHWKPKPESWYYFEPGLVTFGLKEGIHLDDYKKTCLQIDEQMQKISTDIIAGNMPLEEGKKQAQNIVHTHNPQQFVNLYKTQADSVLDLSMGGIHHSWEEDRAQFPNGNIIYEIQRDVMDEFCTIRAFDQGKLTDDGRIRTIHIMDYFRFIDTDPQKNNPDKWMRTPKGISLLSTPYYAMDKLIVNSRHHDTTTHSFIHLFIREGAVTVSAEEGEVRVGQGHSCFLPQETGIYTIVPETNTATVLRSYIPNHG